MKKLVGVALIIGLLLALRLPIFACSCCEEREEKVILAGSQRVGSIVKILAQRYMDENPHVKIIVHHDTLLRAQKQVMNNDIDGVMVTAPFKRRLDSERLTFTPIAKREVKRRERIIYHNYYIATLDISPQLQRFLDFINSPEGKKILQRIPMIEPICK